MIKQYFKKLTIVFILLLGNYYSKATVFNIYIDPILGTVDTNGNPLPIPRLYGYSADTISWHYLPNPFTVSSIYEQAVIYGTNTNIILSPSNLNATSIVADGSNAGLGNYQLFVNTVCEIPSIDPFGLPVTVTFSNVVYLSLPTFSLPLKWKSFEVALNDYNTTDLTWITSSEKNTLLFEVEKSTDAKTWTVIYQQNAAGNSEIEKTYKAIDNEVAFGTTYYRIKQIDMDNKYTYSSVQKVVRINHSDISIYPNPVMTTLNISLNNVVENTIIEIYSLEGRKIMSEKINNLNHTINVENLAIGTYMIRISNSEKTYTSKFVRQ